MGISPDPLDLLDRTFGSAWKAAVISAPGRVNLIGEHIDYHALPVLPVALGRRIRVAFRRRDDRRVRLVSAGGYGSREFEWLRELSPVGAGDWENYARAAAQAIGAKWGAGRGLDAAVVSDLPAAAGLSSSSALIVALTLAMLRANDRHPGFEELMEILPEGEQFVGTRGGGMDHAASLACKPGCACLIGFAPLSLRDVPVPPGWRFLVAHSLKTAEKSGPAREQYNARRAAGNTALRTLGLRSYRDAIEQWAPEELPGIAVARLGSVEERDSFLHVTTEALRVSEAVRAMDRDDAERFGRLLLDSHESLRDRLKVSCTELDQLVQVAMDSGALGARLTGAGFGGCAVVFCRGTDLAAVRERIVKGYYSAHPDFDPDMHLIDAEPAAGALYEQH